MQTKILTCFETFHRTSENNWQAKITNVAHKEKNAY